LLFALLSLVALVASRAPLLGEHSLEKIDGEYIVIFHENTTVEQAEAHWKTLKSRSVEFLHTYHIGTFKGYAAKLSPKHLHHQREHPLVKEVHYNDIARALGDANSCGSATANAPSWGLARVSQKGSMPAGLNDDYYYSNTYAGRGVTVYVIDTGIRITHTNFGGRASYGVNYADNVATDQNGHGTHCAGTVGGSTYGIAKAVNLVAVKVLNAGGSGTLANVIAGMQWTTDRHLATGGPSVASMSLGATVDGGMNAALAASSAQGVVYSVAAGNSNANACGFYPASAPPAATVGSTELASGGGNAQIDRRSSFSNIGTCVDIFAPGSAITSCGVSSDTAAAVLSGTSMACPHVSGQLAVILSQYPSFSPAEAIQHLIDISQTGLIQNVGTGSPNRLLYNQCDEN
jgi:subtilisin family serine protease